MMLSTKNKPVGGEQELGNDGHFYGLTNSGRSSLRWTVRSMCLQGKKVLLPDFVCQVVIDVLLEFDINIIFYEVQDNFVFNLPKDLRDVSAIYLVKYFGHESVSFKDAIDSSETPLIIDDVFGIEAPKVIANVHWCYFNSLRKITPISGFSQLISNKSLAQLRKNQLLEFSDFKYQAKDKKYHFLQSSIGTEDDYLSLLSSAEDLLNSCLGINEPDDKSTFLACQLYRNQLHEYGIRKQNFFTAKEQLLEGQYIDINPDFPTFLPLLLVNRDKVKRELMRYSIFLAVHWPKTTGPHSVLSESILSLPLDSRYTPIEIKRICTLIKRLDV